MHVLSTKKLSRSDLDLIQAWGWTVETIETLRITPVEVNEIPKTEVWVVSSRNSIGALQKFINLAAEHIYCVGNWMKDELLKTGTKSVIRSFENMTKLATDLAEQEFNSVLYFCGDEHRQELDEVLKNSASKISKAITHKSEMTFPVTKNSFDAVFVFSPRSAESLLKHNVFNKQTVFASIGATTAKYLNSRGIANTFTPSYPDTRILLQEFHHQFLES